MQQPEPLQPIDGAATWQAADMADPCTYTHVWSDSDIQAFEALVDPANAPPAPQHDPGVAVVLGGVLGERLAQVRHTLQAGCGFMLLRGLPFERWGLDRSRRVTWAVAHAVGIPVSQTAAGARLVDVMDTSRRESTPRQFSTSQELRLHTDPASDLIGLACVRPARSGGDSVLASAAAIHNTMLAQRPDLLAELYRGFYWHRFGEGRSDDGPITAHKVPVFSQVDGQLSCRYVRSAIAAGQRDRQQPLAPPQVEALDLFDHLASSGHMRVSFRMDAGDIVLVNNLAVLHARTEFVDHDEPARMRHLLRLWLAGFEGFRAVRPELNYFNGGHCGIPAAEGMRAHYEDMAALAADPAGGGKARLGLAGAVVR